jgi:hypothetical protein
MLNRAENWGFVFAMWREKARIAWLRIGDLIGPTIHRRPSSQAMRFGCNECSDVVVATTQL